MKSLLPRSFSRSLPTLLPSSRSNHVHIPTLPDYYRDTRREVYGPYYSAETQSMRTMESAYDSYNESDRSSFLLDIEPPEEFEGSFNIKPHSIDTPDTPISSIWLSVDLDEVEPTSSLPENTDCHKIGRVLLQAFISLICSRNNRQRRKN